MKLRLCDFANPSNAFWSRIATSKGGCFIMANSKMGRVWYALALLVAGIMLIVGGVNGANTIMGIIVTVIGAIVIAMGVMAICSHNVIMGIILIIFGILMISFAWTIAWVAFLVNGVMMIVGGISGLIKRNGGIFSNIMNILIGVVIVMLGCGSGAAWDFMNVFFYIAGALLIVDSILVMFKA